MFLFVLVCFALFVLECSCYVCFVGIVVYFWFVFVLICVFVGLV